jgi:hypothetical protein
MINWEKIYKTLIEVRGLKEKPESMYTELHHIVPKYLGGVDEQENLVRLTLYNHTLAHYILWRWKGNLQDKVAFLMKGGQTEKGSVERVKLAVEASREINRERFLNKNPMKNPKNTEKAKQTRVNRYEGKYHSEQGIQNLKLLSNTGGQHTPEAVKKRVQSSEKTRQNMSDEEYYIKYVKNHTGENSSMYGTKRPGELAGNYGTSKGTYTLISPEGEVFEFKGITKLIKFGVGETLIRNWRNRGKILPQPNYKRSPWIGYEIQYKPNTKYGQTNRQVRKTKRELKQQKPN